MIIDKNTVLQLGQLAYIALNEKQAIKLSSELSQVLHWIEQLQEVDVSDVIPMTSVLKQKLILREDIVNNKYDYEYILANAPMAFKDYFSVPKIIE